MSKRVAFAVVGAFAFVFVCAGLGLFNPPHHSDAPPPNFESLQRLVDLSQSNGLILGVTYTGSKYAVVRTGPLFGAMRFNDKELLAQSVSCLAARDRAEAIVRFEDGYTGKEVAHYYPATGFEMK